MKKFLVLMFVFSLLQAFRVEAEETPGDQNASVADSSQQKAEKAVAETQSAVDNLQEQIKTLNAAIKELSEKKGTLKSTIDELQSQSASLENKTKELQGAVNALKIEREKREKDIQGLQLEKDRLQKESDALSVKLEAITNRRNVDDNLKAKSYVMLVCDTTNYDYSKLSRQDGEFRSPCDIQLHYVGSPPAYFKPSRFVITHRNSSMTVFEKTLSSNQDEETIHPAEWYNSEKIVTGKKYEMWVEYKGNGEVSDVSYKLLTFTMTKKPFVFQITPKLYTAWRHGENEDVTMILPGVGIGGAYRLGDRSDDRNVIGLRGVFAFGPNLTSNNKRLQLVAGAEVVLSRYLSVGAAWVAYGPDREGVPMILLSYGDLYPAVVNTK